VGKKEKIFPLKVEEEVYLSMGEYGSRYKITLADGREVCYCDWRPNYIDLINKIVRDGYDN
jgi:hypothetical protein